MLLADSFLECNGTLFQILAGVLIALVSGLVARHFSNREKPTKLFDYRVLSDVAILSHRPDDNELRVTYLTRNY